LSSQSNPKGSIKCNAKPVLAQRRIILPVLGGISGWYKTISSMGIISVAYGTGILTKPTKWFNS
jgi:hypothetical protein